MTGKSKDKTPDVGAYLTPPRIFGRRLREIREARGWSQSELGRRLNVHSTTINHIEQGRRGDVSISQLFTYATVIGTAPIFLITPFDDTPLQPTVGGHILTPAEARAWIRGLPGPGDDVIEWFMSLPHDEQRSVLARLEGPTVPSDASPLVQAAAGRPPAMTDEQRDQVIELIRQHKEGNDG